MLSGSDGDDVTKAEPTEKELAVAGKKKQKHADMIIPLMSRRQPEGESAGFGRDGQRLSFLAQYYAKFACAEPDKGLAGPNIHACCMPRTMHDCMAA